MVSFMMAGLEEVDGSRNIADVREWKRRIDRTVSISCYMGGNGFGVAEFGYYQER
jgi:hypothetical protein